LVIPGNPGQRAVKRQCVCVVALISAWIKMGEYYAHGYSGHRQPYTAAEMFTNAAIRGDSQVSQHHHHAICVSQCISAIITVLILPRHRHVNCA